MKADDEHYIPRAVLLDLEPRVSERWFSSEKITFLGNLNVYNLFYLNYLGK